MNAAMYKGMFTGTSNELLFSLFALLTGMLLGSVYDLFRGLRMSLKHSALAVASEDLVFTLLFAAVYYCFCVRLLEGAVRLYVLLLMICGFFSYLVTLGRFLSGLVAQTVATSALLVTKLVKIIKKAFKSLCVVPFFRARKIKFSKTSCKSRMD